MEDLSTEYSNLSVYQMLHTHYCLEVLSFTVFSQSFFFFQRGGVCGIWCITPCLLFCYQVTLKHEAVLLRMAKYQLILRLASLVAKCYMLHQVQATYMCNLSYDWGTLNMNFGIENVTCICVSMNNNQFWSKKSLLQNPHLRYSHSNSTSGSKDGTYRKTN